ncbi:MAG: phosphoribosylaminoimidazolesuccinocarboxamide synthase [Deltaproteobacteria bacterium]|nr:phosphoribosylaminoimidazolesuccinocarboxamide synthase [Deltaproteobacteria bacterium]
MKPHAILETNLQGLPTPKRGKVRDIYDLGDTLLIVATDRISCFDVILPTPIPGKGEVLAEMSRFWFSKTNGIIANHLTNRPLADVIRNPEELSALGKRAMLVKKAKPLPVEAIVRGYISGSGWNEYKRQGTICGIQLPHGLKESEQLPEAIFTPSTKAELGEHDENIAFENVVALIGEKLATKVRDASLNIYTTCAAVARERGMIIADTKFEVGLLGDELILIDEVLTPDSSRFWPVEGYKPGGPQPSYDKQFVRDYLLEIGWNKQPPAPELPAEIVAKTQRKYEEALRLLTT